MLKSIGGAACIMLLYSANSLGTVFMGSPPSQVGRQQFHGGVDADSAGGVAPGAAQSVRFAVDGVSVDGAARNTYPQLPVPAGL